MRIHNDFTLYWRDLPSGKRVVYFYVYDENDKRLNGRSTGEITMTAARLKCNRLFKAGTLIAVKRQVPTFAEYAKGWWKWDTCEYLAKRRKRISLTKAYADLSKRNLERKLLPFFGKMPLDKILRNDVERFIDGLIKEEYKNNTINSYFKTLRTMMIEAVDRKIIAADPTEKIGKLIANRKKITIVTQGEFKKLFLEDWRGVWENDLISCTANKLAALTGMRSAEVLGLKGCYVYDDHICVCMQYDHYGYRPTKTKDNSNIGLASSMIAELKELKKLNGEGFLFSTDGGGKPLSRMTIYRAFHRALLNIGLTKSEIAERKLHLHAWRHFCNTELVKGGLSVKQIHGVTRHKTEDMTDVYNHFDPMEFTKALEVQEALLRPGTSLSAETEKPASVLQFPVSETPEQNIQQA